MISVAKWLSLPVCICNVSTAWQESWHPRADRNATVQRARGVCLQGTILIRALFYFTHGVCKLQSMECSTLQVSLCIRRGSVNSQKPKVLWHGGEGVHREALFPQVYVLQVGEAECSVLAARPHHPQEVCICHYIDYRKWLLQSNSF